jgi:hydroxymethylpyrimidine/phosphomethylpyrimidine kinase
LNAELTPAVLTIAGSDPSGGAGIQADLKTFAAYGVYGASVVTALTAQNTLGVQGVFNVPADFIALQIRSVFSDLAVKAIKTGMLGQTQTIMAVTEGLRQWATGIPITVDPVMVAASGDLLLDPDAKTALVRQLLPLATVLTPNLAEAAALLNTGVAMDEAAMEEQAIGLAALGPKAVLVKGGHGSGDEAADILYDGRQIHRFALPRIATKNTHGTGCTLASAITAGLAQGLSVVDAIAKAKSFVHEALRAGAPMRIGHGAGPVWHHFVTKSQS